MSKDDNSEPASGMFNYSSVVGMIMYISGHTRPDFPIVINFCARYMFSPKRSKKLALKVLAHYLKQTKDLGLALDTNSHVCKMDTYPDDHFSGMYGHENPTDFACVQSRTVFFITFAYFPVLWVSKLQTETDLLTMEAEIIAMARWCRVLFPIINITTSLGKAVVLPMGDIMMIFIFTRTIEVLWYWLELSTPIHST